MTENHKPPETSGETGEKIGATDARQGLPSGFMPFILGASTALAIVALFVMLVGFLN